MFRSRSFGLFRRPRLPEWLSESTAAHLEAAVSHDRSVRAALVLEATDAEKCVLRIARGRVRIAPGDARDADTRVRADAETLRAVLDGEASGVAAFLDGKLTSRGSLALALRLDGLVERGGGARRAL